MKVIDLLNKIANDEGIPIKLLFLGKHYEWRQDIKDYMNEDGDYLIEELETYDLNSLCEEIPLEEDNNDVNVANKIIFDFQDRINKAIETIKDEGLVVAIKMINEENEEILLSSKDLLIDILKGSDKSE